MIKRFPGVSQIIHPSTPSSHFSTYNSIGPRDEALSEGGGGSGGGRGRGRGRGRGGGGDSRDDASEAGGGCLGSAPSWVRKSKLKETSQLWDEIFGGGWLAAAAVKERRRQRG